MQADFSRLRFDPAKHYSSVRQQQGRVLLDADWNEQTDIQSHRIEAGTTDVIGPSGAPWHAPGTPRNFKIVGNGTDFTIAPGHYYVDGQLCENETTTAGTAQPHLPPGAPVVRLADGTFQALPAPAGRYLVYLDVWQRHVTELDDDTLHEPALGDVDTTTRTVTAWQVYLLAVPAGTNCATAGPLLDALPVLSTGLLRAQARPGAPDTNTCAVPPGGGYRRLENQLYRVEVHQGGPLGTATFKWSRDNASVAARWLARTNNDLTVSRPSRDSVLGFGGRPFVELSDDTRELQAQPGTLVQLDKAAGAVLTISPATATGSVDLASFPRNPKLRRWDSPGAVKVEVPATNDGWIPLEDGVEVHFEPGDYRTGDYWLIPARTARGDVLWPKTGANPDVLPPHGIRHHYAGLALVQASATGQLTVLSDCRRLFPPLTGLMRLVYVGGDGQETLPGQELDGDLEATVCNGTAPVEGATVRFQIVNPAGGGNGVLTAGANTGTTVPATTDAGGIARCRWRPATNPPAQQVEAFLLDGAGVAVGQPLHFHANLSIASEVAYDRAGCPGMPTTVATVQDAINFLCKQPHGEGCDLTVGKGGDYERLDEALQDLIVKQRLSDICLCLKAGDHHLPNGLQITPVADDRLNVRLAGCGPGTHLHIAEPLVFDKLAALTLRDLAIEAKQGMRRLAILRRCRQIEIVSCRLLMKSDEEAINVTVREAETVRLEECQFVNDVDPATVGLALLIEDAGANVWVRGNEMNAVFALYGPPGALPLSVTDLKTLREKQKRLDFDPRLQRGLWVSDNQLNRITLDGVIVQKLREFAAQPGTGVLRMPKVHAMAIFANNRLALGTNEFLARHVALSGNTFEIPTPLPQPMFHGTVVADAGSLVGNLAPNSEFSLVAFATDRTRVKEAANVMRVEII